jgi:hypothetical protein
LRHKAGNADCRYYPTAARVVSGLETKPRDRGYILWMRACQQPAIAKQYWLLGIRWQAAEIACTDWQARPCAGQVLLTAADVRTKTKMVLVPDIREVPYAIDLASGGDERAMARRFGVGPRSDDDKRPLRAKHSGR